MALGAADGVEYSCRRRAMSNFVLAAMRSSRLHERAAISEIFQQRHSGGFLRGGLRMVVMVVVQN